MLYIVRWEAPAGVEAALGKQDSRGRRGERIGSKGHVLSSRKPSWILRGEVGSPSLEQLVRHLSLHWRATVLRGACRVPRKRAARPGACAHPSWCLAELSAEAQRRSEIRRKSREGQEEGKNASYLTSDLPLRKSGPAPKEQLPWNRLE